MATTFESLRAFVRHALLDSDPAVLKYSNSLIDGHIRLQIMELDEDALTESSEGSGEFTETLSNKNKVRMILKTVLSIITPQDDHFSYKTPILSVVRKGGVSQLRSEIERRLTKVEGGMIAISSDTDLQAMINGVERYCNELGTAAE